jgi:hypothetical protein
VGSTTTDAVGEAEGSGDSVGVSVAVGVGVGLGLAVGDSVARVVGSGEMTGASEVGVADGRVDSGVGVRVGVGVGVMSSVGTGDFSSFGVGVGLSITNSFAGTTSGTRAETVAASDMHATVRRRSWKARLRLAFVLIGDIVAFARGVSPS